MAGTLPPDAEDLITGEPRMAHLATCANGRPHVAPVWYVYEDGVLELVTTGRKLANIRENPRVAASIQADEDGEAKWMVAVQGRATIVEDEEATEAARRRINRRYGAPESAHSENVLVRIEVGSGTYRTY